MIKNTCERIKVTISCFCLGETRQQSTEWHCSHIFNIFLQRKGFIKV